MNIYFFTLGCRVNQYETDAVRKQFLDRGHVVVDAPDKADVCVVNTCTVTSEADRKSRQSLRKMVRANGDTIVCAMGCAAEMSDGVLDADIVCGTRDKNQIVDKVEAFVNEAKNKTHEVSHNRPEVSKSDVYHDFGTVESPEGTRAFVKIEDGCNNFCTYCIIPFARGRVVSRDFDSIIDEVKYLADEGYKEIILSGIHLCSYGKDRGEGIEALLEVIKAIHDIEGVERIRLGSLEPMSMTEEFISAIGNMSKMCPHFHLSLQSGSDTVLKRMGRHYNSEQYLEKVMLLRQQFPTMSLTTDIICGFPGETDEEFEETMEFAKKAGFSKIHVFPYSVREGTVAAKMKQLPGGIARQRTAVLNEWQAKQEELFAESFVGKEVSVLLESYHDDEACYTGYTEEYVKTKVYTDDKGQTGNIIRATVTGRDGNVLLIDN